MITWLLAILSLGTFPINTPQVGDKDEKKFAELEGTWTIVKMEIEGKSLLEKNEKWEVIIKDGRATLAPKKDPDAKPILLAKVLDAELQVRRP